MKIIRIILLLINFKLLAQFAPAVGSIGTTAMHKDSSAFVEWAIQCNVTRGFQDISNPSLGLSTVGDSSMATGKALSNGVVSLGDGGSAILLFNSKVMDGPGYDFAVFENAFNDTYLEFAFVEVSSDGINYFRFPNQCLASQILQLNSFDTTNTQLYHNLAGKYRAGYGTPFDLAELDSDPLLDKLNITHIKIIDVIGSLNNQYSSFDTFGNKINDPFPTPFPSSGFDLDAVGIIHVNASTAINQEHFKAVQVFPNPCKAFDKLKIDGTFGETNYQWEDNFGRILEKGQIQSDEIQIPNYGPGIYFLQLFNENQIKQFKIIAQ